MHMPILENSNLYFAHLAKTASQYVCLAGTLFTGVIVTHIQSNYYENISPQRFGSGKMK